MEVILGPGVYWWRVVSEYGKDGTDTYALVAF